MIPRIPSLFQIEEGVIAPVPMPVSGELVGLRLIIQPSPRQQQLPAVLRRSAVRAPATSASSSNSKNCHENGRTFVGLEFLKCCFCCHKKLGADMDVFVYK
ncbi:hypothetical protein PR202_gb18795 [Eleusine coracana subsp. coracana]|uniref:FLZ-type domain-containing protein n=1 Tax=Eleusine coracana subsp. coracana TaxID=191504 RepID=A0AAV5F696_ELECO|nr:hypothetical protein PR202_gb18795 [Eleusine coracana subsp. coracana]